MFNIKDFLVTDNPDTHFYVTVDMSQLEICGLAEVTKDKVLTKELNSGVDIHTRNASEWLGIPEKDVTEEQRKAIKSISFGLIYGASVSTLADNAKILESLARDIVNRFYKKYRKVYEFHEHLKEIKASHGIPSSKENTLKLGPGFINTITGRTYSISPSESESGQLYWPLTAMKNYPIQGFSTGDLVPYVFNLISFFIEAESYTSIEMVSTVHDDCTYQVSNELIMEFLCIVEFVFQNLNTWFEKHFDYQLQVVYNYDVKIGTSLNNQDKFKRSEIRDLLGV